MAGDKASCQDSLSLSVAMSPSWYPLLYKDKTGTGLEDILKAFLSRPDSVLFPEEQNALDSWLVNQAHVWSGPKRGHMVSQSLWALVSVPCIDEQRWGWSFRN